MDIQLSINLKPKLNYKRLQLFYSLREISKSRCQKENPVIFLLAVIRIREGHWKDESQCFLGSVLLQRAVLVHSDNLICFSQTSVSPLTSRLFHKSLMQI